LFGEVLIQFGRGSLCGLDLVDQLQGNHAVGPYGDGFVELGVVEKFDVELTKYTEGLFLYSFYLEP
jgi:hypothetical protein